MKRNACLILLLFFVGHGAFAERNLWARGATHFGNECKSADQNCRLAYVVSPNRRYAISVNRTNQVLKIEAVEGGKHLPIPLPAEMDAEQDWYVEMEILWAPDSSAVSFSWNSTAITYSTRIYAVGPSDAHVIELSSMRENFIQKFPACIGVEGHCDAFGAEDNYLTVSWAAPHTVVVMAEVPPSSGFGNNMGKVVGYEVDVYSGRILREMPPAEFKHRWQSRMGWNFDLASAQ